MKITATRALHKTSDPVKMEEPAHGETVGGGAPWQPLRSLIAEQPFFKGFNTHHLQLFTDSAREMHFEPGESILEEGSPATRFYLILEGKVVLGAELEDRGIIPVQTLGPGDDLGWSWLFSPHYMHLSARALVPTRTLFFHGTGLLQQCEEDREFGYRLMKRIVEVATYRLRTTQQRLVECTSMRTLSNP